MPLGHAAAVVVLVVACAHGRGVDIQHVATPDTPDSVFVLLSAMSFFGGMFSGPLFAISLTLAPVAARATASACMLVIINLTAIGLAPQVVGNLSDLMHPRFGEESLRIALLGATLMALPTALFFLLASRSYRGDVAEAARRDHALGAGVRA